MQNLHDIGYLHYYLKEDYIILSLEPLNVNNNDSNFILIDYGLSVPFVIEIIDIIQDSINIKGAEIIILIL